METISFRIFLMNIIPRVRLDRWCSREAKRPGVWQGLAMGVIVLTDYSGRPEAVWAEDTGLPLVLPKVHLMKPLLLAQPPKIFSGKQPLYSN